MLRCDDWIDEQLFDIVMKLRLISLRVKNDCEGFGNPLEKEYYETLAEWLYKSSDNVSEARMYLSEVKENGFYE